jgi:hypothetical protein
VAQLRRFTDGLVDRGIERDDSPNELTSNGLRVRQLATGCRQSRDKLTRDLLRQRSENGSEPPPRASKIGCAENDAGAGDANADFARSRHGKHESAPGRTPGRAEFIAGNNYSGETGKRGGIGGKIAQQRCDQSARATPQCKPD